MKALSIRQPWAWLIVNGHKDIENRSRPTKHREEVLIHAGKKLCGYSEGIDDYTDTDGQRFLEVIGGPIVKISWQDDFPCGGIVGIAEILDCVKESDSPWFFGPYGYVLANARPLPFYPCKGQLGFFTPEVPGLCVACKKQWNCDNGWFKSGLCRGCLWVSRDGSCGECHNSTLYCCCPDGEAKRAVSLEKLRQKDREEALSGKTQ